MPRPENRSARPAVIAAVIGLARRGGLDSFSINDLGQALGVSKSCVYRHFESRNDIVAEAMLAYADALARHATRAAAGTPSGLRRLQRMLDVWLGDYVLREGCLILRAGTECANRADDTVSRSAARAVTAWRGLLAAQLEDAVRAGEIEAEVDTQRVVFEIFSFALGLQHDHLFLGDPVEFRQAVLSGILARHGIRIPGATPGLPPGSRPIAGH
ncbi:TetR/AcrR family transcriptional regulator [Cupriavidus consociatus]|uniref:TetR/AcrR family transcriptional regulator n=1 Tax=Cupriavidus consociatus TaxID=2821357 RepID=UPI001AEB11D0|nr:MULTISPECIES: TetR/AcrR family transcriptional regulator [unclassified Cupriavidus]MBP0618910.1 TetR/AcrR family transcriptional regulator [Cupriavidus sp. LEh25]MDK2655553.1 TetR/AcrR family transcriptional regulator [Cupriavidus sp. LEh21]